MYSCIKTNYSEEEIVNIYSKKVKIISRKFFIIGGDYEDLYQEGMIALLYAFRTFNENLNVSFSAYAEKCIKHRLIDLIKSKGYAAYISSDDIDDDIVSDGPEEEIIGLEGYDNLIRSFKEKLSKFEFHVLELFLEGYSYKEISDIVGKPSSSIYNAIQRIRRKLYV